MCGESFYFITMTPLEPPKNLFNEELYEDSESDGEQLEKEENISSKTSFRKALVVILSTTTQRSSEFRVNLITGSVDSRKLLAPGVQPMIVPDEFTKIDEVLRADAQVRSRLTAQGISLNLTVFDIW